MTRQIKVGIVGEYDPSIRYHVSTDEALNHAANALSVSMTSAWIPTPSLTDKTYENTLKAFDAILCAPCDYESIEGALRAIRFAREQDLPFLGT